MAIHPKLDTTIWPDYDPIYDPRPVEADPSGKAPNEPGAKLDQGKVCPSLIIEGMARAIWGVAEVATFGMHKYTRDGWVSVPDGKFRYANAQYRHVLMRAMGQPVDSDSKLLHLKHEAWNALAKLDLALREEEATFSSQEYKK